MSLKTPSRQTFEKKVHTPPSVERDPGKPKYHKTVPRNAFRRSSNSDNDTFDSTGLFVPAPGLSHRGAAPQPLNIPQLLSPPPSVKKKSNGSPSLRAVFQLHPPSFPVGQLESPIHLTPSVKVQSLARPFEFFDLTAAYKSGSRSEPRTEVSPCDDTIIWTDTVDDPYLEEDSPTYLRSISQNISKTSAKAGHRRFIGTQCSMCDEKICNVLSGEKIVEMTCCHASHYQCYLATLECLYMQKKYPQCRVCGKTVKPSDEGTLEKMMSRLLSKKTYDDHSGSTMGPQWFDFKLPTTADRNSLLTPGGQVIQSADISSNGFRTPFKSLDSATFGGCNDFCESFDSIPQRELWPEKTLPEICKGEPESSEDDSCTARPQIHLHSTGDSGSFTLSVEIPSNENKACCQQKEGDPYESERQFLRQQIEASVKEEVDPEDELGTLIMFDKVDYSTDGEQWNKNVMICLFDQFLLLFDRDEMTTRGKIPLSQICQSLKLNDRTLLIDLKSRALPEVYVSFTCENAKTSELQRWKFYLSQSRAFPELENITSNSWSILPEELVIELELFRNKVNGAAGTKENVLAKPWQNLHDDVPLQLIVCLNLSHDAGISNANYEGSIKKGLKALLSCLSERDLLGIVAIGKDGRGNVGNYGTFVGTINKFWPHWGETFDSLQAIDREIFSSPANELDKMLETCLRLVSTADSMLEEGASSHFLKQIILLRAGDAPKDDHKYGALITDVHGFKLMQMAPLDQYHEVGELEQVISLLHQRSMKDLTVKIVGKELYFGDMSVGEKRSLNFEAVNRPLDCQIEWFDVRSQRTEMLSRPFS